jgi:hypothetical protein
MSLLFVSDQEATDKINIDELYEKEQRRDLKQVEIFNKILNRIHKRITTVSRNKRVDKHIWFIVPEYIVGHPIYSQPDCIAFVIAKLTKNGFFVKYIHPNTLFVSWENWVPSYVRTEFKKRTGNVINERGEIIRSPQNADDDDDANSKMLNERKNGEPVKEQKQYTPIGNYKPTGNLVYTSDMFEKLEKKIVL